MFWPFPQDAFPSNGHDFSPAFPTSPRQAALLLGSYFFQCKVFPTPFLETMVPCYHLVLNYTALVAPGGRIKSQGSELSWGR